MPSSLRGILKVRRTCRKKINERITAILGKFSAFSIYIIKRFLLFCDVFGENTYLHLLYATFPFPAESLLPSLVFLVVDSLKIDMLQFTTG